MHRTATEFLGEDAVAALRRPILDEARGLPASVYTSESFFKLEQERLFPRVWMGVAFDTGVPGSGDAIPRQVLGLPIIIVRDDIGQFGHSTMYVGIAPRWCCSSRALA